MKEYVVGFLLSDHYVVLVEKNRPDWQAGLLNGVGGKVEPGERPGDAMRREFREEAGLDLEGWEPFAAIVWQTDERVDQESARVNFYRKRVPTSVVLQAETKTDERIRILPLHNLPGHYDIVPNLAWLIPLAAYQADYYEPFVVHATVAEVLT